MRRCWLDTGVVVCEGAILHGLHAYEVGTPHQLSELLAAVNLPLQKFGPCTNLTHNFDLIAAPV